MGDQSPGISQLVSINWLRATKAPAIDRTRSITYTNQDSYLGHGEMKQLLTLLAISIAVAGCQKPAEPKADAEVAAAPIKAWEPIEFDDKATTVPVYYGGNDVGKFFTLFKERTQAATKGEFETTAEYEKRLADNAETIFAPFKLDAKYAFLVADQKMEYDADKQRYKAEYSSSCYETFFSEGVACEIGKVTLSEDNYEGKNSYGATATVSRQRGEEYSLVLDPKATRSKQFEHTSYGVSLPAQCPVSLDKAKTLKDAWVTMVYVGRVKKFESLRGRANFESATVKSPTDVLFERYGIPFVLTDVVCYARKTGEILHSVHMK